MGRQMELEIWLISKIRYQKSWLLRPDSDTDNLVFVSKDILQGDKLDKWKTLVTFSFG